MSTYSNFNTQDTGAAGRMSEGVAVTGSNTYYGNPISGKNSSGFGIEFIWTGTPTGTITHWISNKPNPSLADDSDWVQESTLFTAVNPAGSASKSQHTLAHHGGLKRFKYVNSSGSGVFYAYVNTVRVA